MCEEIEKLKCSGTHVLDKSALYGGSQASLRALVLRAPGINCDRETAQACRLVGFASDLLHINTLLKAPERLLDYDFLVIPGGFSYGDDLGAGTLLAKNLTIHLGQQIQQFIDEGRPILGICNGFQVLVRAGLLPGFLSGHGDNERSQNNPDAVNDDGTPVGADLSCPPPIYRPPNAPAAGLTDNASAQFECRWVTLSIQPGPCIFTKGIAHPLELPIAHGEGRFVLAESAMLSRLQARGQIPLVYTGPNGGRGRPQGPPPLPVPQTGFSTPPPPLQQEVPYPYNPNGSIGNIAGICNAQGNVFGLMPHPERYIHALQHPLRGREGIETRFAEGPYGHDGQGDGLLIFKNAYDYAKALQLHVRTGIY